MNLSTVYTITENQNYKKTQIKYSPTNPFKTSKPSSSLV